MKSLFDLCCPRKSVFDRQRRDVVLDLTDFVEQRIVRKDFFEENHLTDGMKRLLRESFRRFGKRAAFRSLGSSAKNSSCSAGRFEHSLPDWKADGASARVLAGALENDHR